MAESLEAEDGFQDRSGTEAMTGDGFGGAVGDAFRREKSGEPLKLEIVVAPGGGAVGVDVADVGRRDCGAGDSLIDGPGKRTGTGGFGRGGLAIGGETPSGEEAVNSRSPGMCGRERFQNQKCTGLAQDGAGGGLVEGTAGEAGGQGGIQDASGEELTQEDGMERGVHSADQGNRSTTGADVVGGEGDGMGTGGAGG